MLGVEEAEKNGGEEDQEKEVVRHYRQGQRHRRAVFPLHIFRRLRTTEHRVAVREFLEEGRRKSAFESEAPLIFAAGDRPIRRRFGTALHLPWRQDRETAAAAARVAAAEKMKAGTAAPL